MKSAKRAIQAVLRLAGLEIVRVNPRTSLLGALLQAQRAGLSPQSVIDVGAAWGDFTRQCLMVFPEARYLMVEPLMEYHDRLAVLSRANTKVEFVVAAAAATQGTVSLNVHPDLVGSSLYIEHEDSHVNGVPRLVSAVTLDQLAAERVLRPPYLVKVDVQGGELAVLAGATELLRQAEYVMLEVSLLEFFEGGPLLHEIVASMHSLGLVVYDVLGQQYRPLDRALAQLDMIFVKEHSHLRRYHYYATPEQRHALTLRNTTRK